MPLVPAWWCVYVLLVLGVTNWRGYTYVCVGEGAAGWGGWDTDLGCCSLPLRRRCIDLAGLTIYSVCLLSSLEWEPPKYGTL
jgi:hypothetical protein